MTAVPPPTTDVFVKSLLRGKIAIVTGGGSGICKGIAAAFVRHGAAVVIVGRKKDKLEAAAAEISRAEGGVCVPMPADVRSYEAIEAVVAATVARFGRLDIFLNGAAGNFLAAADTLSANAFKTVVDIDLNGTFNGSRAAFPHLAVTHGVILNISATLHYKGIRFQSHASAAKAGVDALTRAMATEWGPSGVRVVGIAPGPIDATEGMARLMPAGYRDAMIASVPVQRMGQIRDIEHAALYIVSAAAAYVTGTVLVVDGGSWFTDHFAASKL